MPQKRKQRPEQVVLVTGPIASVNFHQSLKGSPAGYAPARAMVAAREAGTPLAVTARALPPDPSPASPSTPRRRRQG